MQWWVAQVAKTFQRVRQSVQPDPEAQRDQLVRLMRWFERVPDEAIWNQVYGKRMVQDALVRLFSTSLVATRHKTDPPHRPTAARVLAVSLPVLHAKRYLTPDLKEKLRVPVQDMLKYLRHKEHTHRHQNVLAQRILATQQAEARARHVQLMALVQARFEVHCSSFWQQLWTAGISKLDSKSALTALYAYTAAKQRGEQVNDSYAKQLVRAALSSGGAVEEREFNRERVQDLLRFWPGVQVSSELQVDQRRAPAAKAEDGTERGTPALA